MNNLIYPAPERQTVQVRFPNNTILEGPKGDAIEAFVKAAQLPTTSPVVAALRNGQLRELSRPVDRDADVVPITLSYSDGMRIYRRSLSFLLIAAAAELFPGCIITIHHSMPFGGYYCERQDRQQLTDEELERLRQRMQALVDADLPINQVQVPLAEALRLFRASGDLEKAELFANRRKDYLTLYELNGVRDYFHGFMVPRTSYLSLFALRHYGNGFILQYPRRQQPDKLQPFEDEPRLARVFQEYSEWLRIIGVPHVTAMNEAIRNGRIQEVILVAEAFHQLQLSNVASDIASQRGLVKIILISGPTSAGKTTFSKRLAIQLMAQGMYPITMGMDNYFVNRDKTPRDENGDYDFETIEAVDIHLFQHHLQQ
ncbi:MAG: nucleoside kinase, partial [Anaerolineales bacterium]|nr:nucleoside kinase [Anaerolineales bacterium]